MSPFALSLQWVHSCNLWKTPLCTVRKWEWKIKWNEKHFNLEMKKVNLEDSLRGSQGHCRGPGTTLWEVLVYKTMFFMAGRPPHPLSWPAAWFRLAFYRAGNSKASGLVSCPSPPPLPPMQGILHKTWYDYPMALLKVLPCELPSRSSHQGPAPWSDCSQYSNLRSLSGPLICLVVLAKPSPTHAFYVLPLPLCFCFSWSLH